MVTRQRERIVETKTEARAGDSHTEPMHALTRSTLGAVACFVAVWIIFFH